MTANSRPRLDSVDSPSRNARTSGDSEVPPTPLTGAQRAAIVLLSVGDERGAEIMKHMTTEEVQIVSTAMVEIGSISAKSMSETVLSFMDDLGNVSSTVGGLEQAEKFLRKALPEDVVQSIMKELTNHSKSDIWRKLPTIDAGLVLAFLKGEHPQTIAFILSRCGAAFAARMLKHLDQATASDVVQRMLRTQPIDTEALHNLEDALRLEFLASGARKPRKDTHAEMADIFNYLDDRTQTLFMDRLESFDEHSAVRVRNLMFTFNDLLKIDQGGIQTILQAIDKDVLGRALVTAGPELVALFVDNMSVRSAKRLQDDMAGLPKLTRAETDAARAEVLAVTKRLIDKGDVRRPTGEVEAEGEGE